MITLYSTILDNNLNTPAHPISESFESLEEALDSIVGNKTEIEPNIFRIDTEFSTSVIAAVLTED